MSTIASYVHQSRQMAAPEGSAIWKGRVATYRYGGREVVIREGSLGDGLGAKVWMVAHLLCLELAAHPRLLAGRRVLEVGSGCGVVGLAAAALGAASVVLTDVEGPVLRNLRDCMHLNRAGASGAAGAAGGGGAGGGGGSADADGAAPGPGTGAAGPGEQAARWESGSVSVRLLDWAESVRALEGAAPGGAGAAGGGAGDLPPAAVDAGDLPPGVPAGERFSLVVGSEVMYEAAHARLVAAVLKHRLAPGGVALLNCAVRELKPPPPSSVDAPAAGTTSIAAPC
ncbi:hypothetical protein TSOC_013998 [Tetrabaena socialis]|uniref:Protein N-lysine methyltransferase METTL21A n=1 Tax=Tetrabaena socialis TaxID=47790 RepID=A0A2J7ZIV8_9CHLO|nr:hypothetical protein TSOC_013998 [Tetrabaena socialis]|eukprot:PNH00198.1 hypothetical protein TSOC_013998 [Tetrabaena socialis]